MNLLGIISNTQYRIVILVGLLLGGAVTVLPLKISAAMLILMGGAGALFLSYIWPEFFLILAVGTNFLKFTFLFSAAGLGITPHMIFLALAASGYGLRILSGKQRLVLPVGLGFLIAFFGFTTLSLLLARDSTVLGHFFRTILDWLLMFLLIQMITSRQSLKRLIIALFVQAAIVMGWAFTESIQTLGAGLTFATPDYDSFFWNQFRKNDFAIYLAFVLLLSLAVLLRSRNRLQRRLAVLLLVPIPLAWFVTHSRSGLVAIILSLFLYVILERNRKLLRLLTFLTILGGISFAVFPSEERDLVIDGFRAIIDPDSAVEGRSVYTINVRFQLMEASLETIAGRPLLGIGYRQWRSYSPAGNYRRDARTGELFYDPLEIHNRHLGIATERGLFALLSYLGFVGVLLVKGIRARRISEGFIRSLLNVTIAYLIASQIAMTFTTGLLWEWPTIGILAGLINLVEIEQLPDRERYKSLRFKFLPRPDAQSLPFTLSKLREGSESGGG